MDFSPAFSKYYKNDLYLTAFALGGNDKVWKVSNFVENCNSAKPELITDALPWPNAIQEVPMSVFGEEWFTVSGNVELLVFKVLIYKLCPGLNPGMRI